MISLMLVVLGPIVLTMCWPAYEHSERVMLAKLILCSAMLYGLAMCWAAKMVLE